MLRNVRHVAEIQRMTTTSVDGIARDQLAFLTRLDGTLAGMLPSEVERWSGVAPGAAAVFLCDAPGPVEPLDLLTVHGLEPREAVLGSEWIIRAVVPVGSATKFVLSR